MSKPTPEQVRARRDLARVTAEIDVQMGGADHRVNLAECHLALRASHADLLSALKAEVSECACGISPHCKRLVCITSQAAIAKAEAES